MQKFWGAKGARANLTQIRLLHFYIAPRTCEMSQFYIDFRFGGPTPRAGKVRGVVQAIDLEVSVKRFRIERFIISVWDELPVYNREG